MPERARDRVLTVEGRATLEKGDAEVNRQPYRGSPVRSVSNRSEAQLPLTAGKGRQRSNASCTVCPMDSPHSGDGFPCESFHRFRIMEYSAPSESPMNVVSKWRCALDMIVPPFSQADQVEGSTPSFLAATRWLHPN